MTTRVPELSVDIAFEGAPWDNIPDLDAVIDRALRQTLAVSGAKLRDGAEVSVLLCHDDFMAGLNKQWRDRDVPTNVLSFPAGGEVATAPILGDIIIAFETTKREAAEENKSFVAHFTHLAVHGFLHLLGYDHESEAEAEEMEALERAVLAALNIADPYVEVRIESGSIL